MRRAFSFALLMSVAGITLDHSARAESSEQEPSAQAKYRTAMDAIDRKDWSEARRLLLELWERSQTYDVAASLSQVEFQLGNFATSARFLSFAIANAPPMESPARLERYKAGLDELRPKVATVRVVISDPSARLTIDGAAPPPLGPNSETFLEPGTHNLEATVPSGSAVAKTVDAVAGQRYEVALNVNAVTPHPPAPAPVPNPPSTPVQSSLSLTPVYVGAGLAAGGAVMALGFGIAAKNAESDWDAATREVPAGSCAWGQSSGRCSDIRDIYDRQRRDADFARVGVGVFVGASVATLAYVLFWPRATQASTGARIILPMASTNSIGVTGTF